MNSFRSSDQSLPNAIGLGVRFFELRSQHTHILAHFQIQNLRIVLCRP